MNERLHRHLDGDLAATELNDEDRQVADEWERMVASFRSAAPRGGAPPWLEQKVMAEIETLPERRGLSALVDWLLRPAQVRVSPLAGALVMGAFVAVLALPGRGVDPISPVDGAVDPVAGGTESVVYVQFVLEAPTASSVAVAGDFSEWDPSFALQDVDGDGVWTGRVPIRPGVHSYMFLIDGTDWQTDPNADRYQDDGFGNQNAIVAVAAGE